MAIPIFQPQDNPTRNNFNARIQAANAAIEAEAEARAALAQTVGGKADTSTVNTELAKKADADAMNTALAAKQDTLSGAAGQVVGFDAEGKPVAQGTQSLVGPQGPQGPAGPQGPVGPAGAQGSAGPAGADGKTAYQYAVDGGYTGTEAEFQTLMGSGPWLPLGGGTVTGPLVVQGLLTLGAGGTVFDIPYSTAVSFFKGLELRGYSISFRNRGDATKGIGIYGVDTPTTSDGAVNKQYVDDLVGDIASLLDAINGEVV